MNLIKLGSMKFLLRKMLCIMGLSLCGFYCIFAVLLIKIDI